MYIEREIENHVLKLAGFYPNCHGYRATAVGQDDAHTAFVPTACVP